jgi:hypothetical protein
MPAVFAMGDYTAHVRSPIVDPQHEEDLMIAVRDCPVNAISALSESGYTSDDHDQKGENEEHGGKIRQYQRKHRD